MDYMLGTLPHVLEHADEVHPCGRVRRRGHGLEQGVVRAKVRNLAGDYCAAAETSRFPRIDVRVRAEALGAERMPAVEDKWLPLQLGKALETYCALQRVQLHGVPRSFHRRFHGCSGLLKVRCWCSWPGFQAKGS